MKIPPDKMKSIKETCKNIGRITTNSNILLYGLSGKRYFHIGSASSSFFRIRQMHKKSYIARNITENVPIKLWMKCNIIISPCKIILDFLKQIN